MADGDAEARTRAQREAAIKDSTSVFDKHVRSLNKVARKIQGHFTSGSDVDVEAVQDLSKQYESIVDSISDVFEKIVDLSLDSPPEEVKADFKRIDAESSIFLRDVSDRVCKIQEQERLDRSHSHERQMFENQTRSQVDQSESISNLCSQLVLNRLPSAEPEVFSGDPLQYNDWMNSFEALISSRSLPDSEGIFYLKKYLSGEARSCVQGLLSLSTSEAFHNALKVLKERFGDDFVIANAFRQKLRKWPKIQNHDYVGLRDFSDYLNNVLVAKESNQSLAILDDENENRILLYKIPDFCLNKWQEIVSSALMSRRSFPRFDEFCRFLSLQSHIKNNPVTAVRSGPPSSQSGNNSRTPQSSQAFAGRPRYSNAVSAPQRFDQAARTPSCFYCTQPHVLSNCQSFTSLPLNDRREFCKTQRLCFGCLRHGHSNRDCRNRMRCATCNRQHPTVLHDDNWQLRPNYSNVPPLMPPLQPDRPPRSYFEASAPVQFQNTNKGVGSSQQGVKTAKSNKINATQIPVAQDISSMIVPVYLSHASCPDQKKLVYALLDTQSDTSFITDQTLDSFNVKTEETVLNINTMNACMPVLCREVNGFKVQGYNCTETFKLPALYSRYELPHDRSHIPTSNFCNKFPHLKDVATS